MMYYFKAINEPMQELMNPAGAVCAMGDILYDVQPDPADRERVRREHQQEDQWKIPGGNAQRILKRRR